MTDLELGSASLITDLWRYKAEGTAPDGARSGHVLMFPGSDNVHGSVKRSASGERTLVQSAGSGGVGYKSQNNTLAHFTDRPGVNGFRDELAREHAVAMAQRANPPAGG
jgi:hypothetical protein